jgi:Ca2+-binding EF-hand superfamily protein
MDINMHLKTNFKLKFRKYDKKIGTIKPDEVADCFRMAGQNPTLEESQKMIEEAEESCIYTIFI